VVDLLEMPARLASPQVERDDRGGEQVVAGPILAEDGPWIITGGTGAYANVYGQGTLHKIIDVPRGVVTIMFTGEVHFE